MTNRRKSKPGHNRKRQLSRAPGSEQERDRLRAAARQNPSQRPIDSVHRSLETPVGRPLDPKAILALQQTIGNQASGKMISAMRKAEEGREHLAPSEPPSVQRSDDVDYAFGEDTIYGDGGASYAEGGGPADDAGSGYGYEFGDDSLTTGDDFGSPGGDGSFDSEGGQDTGGEGYGYEFGGDSLATGDNQGSPGGAGSYESGGGGQDMGGEGYGYEFGGDSLATGDDYDSSGGGGSEYGQSPDEDQGGDGYGYEFGEDPLAGGGF